ncbi:Calx-beta domain-containing protein [Azohydromonas lata]|uniref:Calx-beta domain-containing protein n=1 Tax=Azohydromonas lata TaxID=45677 RepID=A0ABU5IGW1_9BURK|nr:Calx-beta domain-containing protein [Azohydromonas lata]MDZ5458368.1 Calx-beta domain-containing protein [Azohydromonas lata]
MPITVDDVDVDESSTVARFTLRLTAPSALPVSVSYSNSNATAANGSDYSARSGTVTFAPGQTVLTVDIPILANTTAERTEFFLLNLFSPVNDTIARNTAWATIYDNDQILPGAPVIRVGDRVVDESAGVVSFTVTLDRPATGNVSVHVATANGTALAGSDYTALSQTLLFSPGQTAKTVSVALINDAVAEGAETFDLVLSAPAGGVLAAPALGRATIGANDATPVISPLISVSDAVADESDASLRFVVSLSAPATQQVSVSYSNSNVTAANGSDYLAGSGTLVFLPGQTTQVVTVPVLDDTTAERTELVRLNLFSAVNGTIVDNDGLGTVHDNDALSGTPVIRVADTVVDESAGFVTFTVALDRPSTSNVSVNVATVNGTAIAGSDYTALAAQTLTFTPGQVAKTVSVALANDGVAELDETFMLQLSAAVGGVLAAPTFGRATIGANDATPVAQPLIRVSDAVADESDTALRFVVSFSAPSNQTVSVSYSNSNVTAANGSDYVALSNTLVFAPGETTKVVVIPVLNDTTQERVEFARLNLFSAVNGVIVDNDGLGTLYDNDAPSGTPVIQVADSVVDEAAGSVTFTLALDRPSTSNVSVNVATANGTALAGADYSAQVLQTLTFTPGQTVKTVTVALANDALAEGTEYFDLVLSSPVNATLPDNGARAFIGANDAPAAILPLVSVSDAQAGESDGALQFIVSLNAPSTQQVSVSYSNSNLTAANGSDYAAQSNTLVFAPGETTKVLSIPVLDNTTAEPAELLRLNLFSAVNATIVDGAGLGWIQDNDAPSGVPVIRVDDGIADEGGGFARFNVTLDRPSTSQVTVVAATADGTASAGADYDAQAAQVLVFAPGETSKTVLVPMRNDAVAEGVEFFDLQLSSAVNATIGDVRGHMAIAPSDMATAATPTVSAAAIWAPEAGTALDFVVSLSAPSAQQVSVSYSNSNGSAANGSDYVALSGTLVFAPGQTMQVVRIPLLDNLVAETPETFALNLFSAVNAVVGGTPVVATIVDDDPAPAGQLTIAGTGNADVLVGRPGANIVNGGAGNDLLDGEAGVIMRGGAGNDVYIVEAAGDTADETGGSGTDTVVAYINHTLAAGLENLLLRGAAVSGAGNAATNLLQGNALGNTLSGGAGNDTLRGAAGADTLSGGTQADSFVFDNLAGMDSITDWSSADDSLLFSMAGVRVGDGDTVVENALLRNAPGGFGTAAELVVFSQDIAGAITTASAAAAIGSATSAYAVGDARLFAVDNGAQTGVFLFRAAAADALISAAELTPLVLATGGASALSDYLFVA